MSDAARASGASSGRKWPQASAWPRTSFVHRRHHVEHDEPLDRSRVIERHAIGDPRAPVVSHYGEPVETQDLHQSDKLAGHLALAVALTPWSAGRCDRVSVATEVRRDDGVGPGELRRNLTPAVVRLWKAVEEQHRRPRAAQHQVVAHIADANPPMLQERGFHPDNRGTVNDD